MGSVVYVRKEAVTRVQSISYAFPTLSLVFESTVARPMTITTQCFQLFLRQSNTPSTPVVAWLSTSSSPIVAEEWTTLSRKAPAYLNIPNRWYPRHTIWCDATCIGPMIRFWGQFTAVLTNQHYGSDKSSCDGRCSTCTLPRKARPRICYGWPRRRVGCLLEEH